MDSLFTSFSGPLNFKMILGGSILAIFSGSLAQAYTMPTFVQTSVAWSGGNAFNNYPDGVFFNASGNNLLVSVITDNKIYSIKSGIRSVIVGSGASGPAGSVVLTAPSGVWLDKQNYLVVTMTNRVIKISPLGAVTYVAGTGSLGSLGDGGQATSASIAPYSAVCDTSGRVFITDAGQHRIRKVELNGIISTIAGSGSSAAFSGANGQAATSASTQAPIGVCVNSAGEVFFTTWNNAGGVFQITTANKINMLKSKLTFLALLFYTG